MEHGIQKLFANLESLGIMAEPRVLFSLCRVMIKTSVERALYDIDGYLRPSDRLDYRYIDGLVKLIVMLLKQYSISKSEFIQKFFEFTLEAIDEEHKAKRSNFN